MIPQKFQVGDLVVCVVKNGGDCGDIGGPKVGMKGIVRAAADQEVSTLYGVEFAERTPGMHKLNGRLDEDSGWWCTNDALEFAEPDTDEDIVAPNLALVL